MEPGDANTGTQSDGKEWFKRNYMIVEVKRELRGGVKVTSKEEKESKE